MRRSRPPKLRPLPVDFIGKAVVRQTEIAAIIATFNALGETILGIRRRLEAGAAVEHGKYTAKSNLKSPISLYEEAGPNTRLGMWGLDIEEQPGEKVLRARNVVTIGKPSKKEKFPAI